MKYRVALMFLLSVSVSITAFADEPPSQPDKPTPPAEEPAKAPRRVHPMAALMANPAAWNEPEHYIAVVNEGFSVDAAWLAEFLPNVAKYCQLRFEIVDIEKADDASPAALLARTKAAAGDMARGFLVLSDDLEEPIVTAPGSGWAIMNPSWVLSDTTVDAEKANERMGKQFYRTLGLAFGAGYRLEKEAVLRDAPTPQSLDEALSRNFHPQNLAIVQSVAERMGLELRKLKKRSELEALGLIPPKKKPETPANQEVTP